MKEVRRELGSRLKQLILNVLISSSSPLGEEREPDVTRVTPAYKLYSGRKLGSGPLQFWVVAGIPTVGLYQSQWNPLCCMITALCVVEALGVS